MSDEGAVPAASPTLPLSPALQKTLFSAALQKTLFSPALQKTLFSAALLEAKSQKRKLYFLPPCKNKKVRKGKFIAKLSLQLPLAE